jgi:hypothetical protein
MLRSMMTVLVCALALGGCGDQTMTTVDSGSTGTDGGSLRTDSGSMRTDAGPEDECAASSDDAVSSVGCNGGFESGDPAPNAPGGTCTVGGETNPEGSCTGETAFCAGDEGATDGICIIACPPASTYVSTGACPTGFRCFRSADDYGICYRDCDATHPCPTGMGCDDEGSCVPDAAPQSDGGGPTEDAGVIDTDASVGDTDAGTGEPDAGTGDTDAGTGEPDAGTSEA